MWAVLGTLFCCLPFGIVSIVFASQKDASTWRAVSLAREASGKAKSCTMLSAGLALIPITLYLIFALFLGSLGCWAN